MKESTLKIEPKTDRKIPDLSPFIGRKIKNLRCSVGVHIAGQVLTAIDAERHGVDMTQGPMGVLLKKNDQEKLVYIGNLVEAALYPQE